MLHFRPYCRLCLDGAPSHGGSGLFHLQKVNLIVGFALPCYSTVCGSAYSEWGVVGLQNGQADFETGGGVHVDQQGMIAVAPLHADFATLDFGL